MKERPILFSAPMVRAILGGTKTQTRRIVKPQPLFIEWFEHQKGFCAKVDEDKWEMQSCPYGQPGDRLWVKETHSFDPESHPDEAAVIYRADPEWDDEYEGLKWKPSIFMRREYSRLTLEIEAIRVERLQDISGPDAIAEGVHRRRYLDGGQQNARLAYGELWVSINGTGSWDANPWVWVVTFKKLP